MFIIDSTREIAIPISAMDYIRVRGAGVNGGYVAITTKSGKTFCTVDFDTKEQAIEVFNYLTRKIKRAWLLEDNAYLEVAFNAT